MPFFKQPKRIARKAIAKLHGGLAMLVLAGAVTTGAYAAFTDTTTNSGNSITSGTVTLNDNDGNAAMFSALTGLGPGSSYTRCIKVTHAGSLASRVSLYGTTTGSGLDPYMSLQVTRGTYSSDPGFSSCTNFVADSTTYISGQSTGVVYAGTLEGFPDTSGTALVDPTSGTPESWTTDEVHVYKFEITAGDNRSAEGKTVTQTFTWEANSN